MRNNNRVLIPKANFRDIGGIETHEGKTIQLGQIFRSGHLCELASSEKTILSDLNLRTIIDLRRPKEIEERPHPYFEGCLTHEISVSSSDNEFAVVAGSLNKPDMAEQASNLIDGYFEGIITKRLHLYQPVFHVATQPKNYPLLFNCSAGKDRTGFVAAILLRLLGVEEEKVIDDFLLSNEVRKDQIELHIMSYKQRLAKEMGFKESEIDNRHLEPFLSLVLSKPSYMKSVFSAIESGWDSWEMFRREGLKISDDSFDIFRDFMLQ